MYVPRQYRQDDTREMHALMRATRLATLVTVASGEPHVSHVPMLLDPTRGAHGTLRAHLARANPQARELATGGTALVIFLGPNAYVSPNWYESKREHGKVVPTWNYLAVHATGIVRTIDDETALHALMEALTDHREAGREEPWRVDDAPAEYVTAQLRAIVGFEIEIARLDGKWKLSQGRTAREVEGVAAAMEAGDDELARATAAAMRIATPAGGDSVAGPSA